MPVAGIVRRFLNLSPLDRALTLRAALLLTVTRLAIVLLSLRTVQRTVRLLAGAVACADHQNRMPPEQIARAVTRAATVVPRATCLVQALVAKALLEQQGLPALLRVGVDRTTDAEFRGHAWVESGGVIVIGGDEASRYTVLQLQRDDRP